MKAHFDANAAEQLDDEALLEREASERREFLRLMDREPHLRQTRYRTTKASPALLRAWSRWSSTMLLARVRGLRLLHP